MPNVLTIALIPLLPLAGFLLLGLFGKKFPGNSAGAIGTLLLLISFVLAAYTAYDYFSHSYVGFYPRLVPFKYTWLEFSPGVSIDMGIMLDPISVMMIVVVTFVSLMVHIYSLSLYERRKKIFNLLFFSWPLYFFHVGIGAII